MPATLVTVSAPRAGDTVHSQFTVSGTVNPASDNLIGVVVVNGNNAAFSFPTADTNGNWSAGFTVNADNFPNNSMLYVWPLSAGPNYAFKIIA